MSNAIATNSSTQSDEYPPISRQGWFWTLVIGSLFVLLFRFYLTRSFFIITQANTWSGAISNFLKGKLNSDWSHALIIPLISIYFIVQNKNRLSAALQAESCPSLTFVFRLLGLPLFLFAWVIYLIPIHYLGFIGGLIHQIGPALIATGLALFLAGPDLRRLLWAPLLKKCFGIIATEQRWERAFGAILVFIGVLSYGWWLGPGRNDMFQGYSMILCLLGLVLFILGPAPMSVLWFPIVYLTLGVKVAPRWWDAIAVKLQFIAANSATMVLKILGVDANVEGSTISLAFLNNGAWSVEKLNVAEACAGLRMLMAFIALGVAMAYLAHRPWWQRLIMVLMAVPIAVFINVSRVTTIGLLFMVDKDMARGDFHIFVGLLMLLPAAGLFWFLGWVLDHLVIYDEQPPSTPQTPSQLSANPAAISNNISRATNAPTPPILRGFTLGIAGTLLLCLNIAIVFAFWAPHIFLIQSTRTVSGQTLDNNLAWLAPIVSNRPLLPGLAVGAFVLLATSIFLTAKTAKRVLAFPAPGAARTFILALAAGMLVTAASGIEGAVSMMRVVLFKQEVPLRKTLAQLADRAGSWEMTDELTSLPKEEVEALGTKQYIRRLYHNTAMPPNSPGSRIFLHVAYYTGTPDTVPHVPERCFVAGGLNPAGNPHTTTLRLSGPQYRRLSDGSWSGSRSRHPYNVTIPDMSIPATIFTFSQPDAPDRLSNVIYFFAANGAFLPSPDQVRLNAFHPSDRYSYYCKIELLLDNVGDEQAAAARASAFLSDMLPEIMACLPDWPQVLQGVWPPSEQRTPLSPTTTR